MCCSVYLKTLPRTSVVAILSTLSIIFNFIVTYMATTDYDLVAHKNKSQTVFTIVDQNDYLLKYNYQSDHIPIQV